jgi:pyroglutamyl-peptidase
MNAAFNISTPGEMLDPSDHAGTPSRAALLITGFGPFPGAPINPTAEVVERLIGQAWAPRGVRVRGLVAPVRWSGSAETIGDALRDSGCDGALLLGVSGKAREFRVEMRAQNHADRRRPDADGKTWRNDKIDPTGPAVARSTAPVADMVRAIQDAGFPAEASSDAGDYLCNFTLYRILTGPADGMEAPSVGFLHVPQVIERDGEDVPLEVQDIERAVKAAANAFALSLMPRAAAYALA